MAALQPRIGAAVPMPRGCCCPTSGASTAVTITNFTGSVKGGDLVLEGQCSECRGDVARLIEMG